MKNAALKKLVEVLKERPGQPFDILAKGLIIQHLSDDFYEKEREKQKKNKVVFSEVENNITR